MRLGWLRFGGNVKMRPVHMSVLKHHPHDWPPDKGGEYDDTGAKGAYIRLSPDQSGESLRQNSKHEVRHHVLTEWTKEWDIHLTDAQEHDLIAKLEEGDCGLRDQFPGLWT